MEIVSLILSAITTLAIIGLAYNQYKVKQAQDNLINNQSTVIGDMERVFNIINIEKLEKLIPHYEKLKAEEVRIEYEKKMEQQQNLWMKSSEKLLEENSVTHNELYRISSKYMALKYFLTTNLKLNLGLAKELNEFLKNTDASYTDDIKKDLNLK